MTPGVMLIICAGLVLLESRGVLPLWRAAATYARGTAGPYQPALVRARARVCCERGCACLRVRGSASVCLCGRRGRCWLQVLAAGSHAAWKERTSSTRGPQTKKELGVVCAMRTQSLCLRPYHMERGPVAGSRMRHKRTSGAAMRAWAHGRMDLRLYDGTLRSSMPGT